MEPAHSVHDLVCSKPAGLGTRTQDRLAAFAYNTIATVLGGGALLRDAKRAHPATLQRSIHLVTGAALGARPSDPANTGRCEPLAARGVCTTSRCAAAYVAPMSWAVRAWRPFSSWHP
ncbi:hypothetical protein PSP20601_05477 [Pandoraea sputorum]|nr:hypothetical protein PSP20601_05477 [Pandoraea sputorum]